MAGEASALQWKSEIQKSRKPHVFARIHLEIQDQRIFSIRLNHLLGELHEDRVLAKDGIFVHRLEIDGDKEWPVDFLIDSLAALDAENLGDFEELHPRVHHHLLHAGRGDLVLQFVENDMVNHEGKANRRFQRPAQVRIGAPDYLSHAAHEEASISETDFTLAAGRIRLRKA